MCGLHTLPYHPHQVFAQGVQVCLVPKLGGECFQGLSRVVLPAVEAAVYEGLDATSEGVEQGSDHKRGDDDGQLGLLLLATERAEDRLGCRYTSEVDQRQQEREGAVDEGAVDQEVYVIEAIAKDSYPYGDRNGFTRDCGICQCGPLEPEGCVYC